MVILTSQCVNLRAFGNVKSFNSIWQLHLCSLWCSLNLLVNCLFRENRILIGQLHNIPMQKKRQNLKLQKNLTFMMSHVSINMYQCSVLTIKWQTLNAVKISWNAKAISWKGWTNRKIYKIRISLPLLQTLYTQKNCRWFLQSYSTCKVWRSWLSVCGFTYFTTELYWIHLT